MYLYGFLKYKLILFHSCNMNHFLISEIQKKCLSSSIDLIMMQIEKLKLMIEFKFSAHVRLCNIRMINIIYASMLLFSWIHFVRLARLHNQFNIFFYPRNDSPIIIFSNGIPAISNVRAIIWMFLCVREDLVWRRNNNKIKRFFF